MRSPIDKVDLSASVKREVKRDKVQEQILEKLTLISEQLAEVIKLLKAK